MHPSFCQQHADCPTEKPQRLAWTIQHEGASVRALLCKAGKTVLPETQYTIAISKKDLPVSRMLAGSYTLSGLPEHVLPLLGPMRPVIMDCQVRMPC